jgi:enoyl-CoA hydratase/carnithine racemase
MAIAPQGFLYALDPATGVATVTLNRPEKLNALTFDIYRELKDVFTALDTEPGVRAVVLTGAGRAFCAGGDYDLIIKDLLSRDYPGLLDFTRLTCRLILAIRRCRRPVVAALNGLATGAGAVIATACDFRIAAETARIAFLFTSKVGLSGADMGASYLLPRTVGLAKANELLMLGEFVEPKEAERIGLYHRVVPDPQVAAEARAWAEKLARGPSFALAMTKELLNREASMDLDGALELEAEVQAACMQHANFRESYEAFKAKRPPNFS